jgi:predicted dehydrogenase
MEDADLVAVVDTAKGRAEEIASRYGTRAVTDLRDLLKGSLRPDAVSIATPTIHHAEVAVPFLQAGIGTLIEKPLADSLEEADQILDAARTGGGTLQVGHIERFNPAIRAVRDIIKDPRFIECDRIAPFAFRSADIGVVHDLMIHDIDIILSLTREPVTDLDALGACILSDREDLATVRLVFGEKCVAHVKASRVALKTLRKIRIFQEDCHISLDYGTKMAVVYRKKPGFNAEELRRIAEDPAAKQDVVSLLFGKFLSVEEISMEAPEEPLLAELRSFVRAIRDGTEPEVTGEDGRRAMEVAGRILRQIRLRWDARDPTR